jgi:hypothetical protein
MSHGAMKAARNARFRLIPGNVRAQVIAPARISGKTRVVEAAVTADSPVFTDQERKRALDWLATKATRQTIKDQIDWLTLFKISGRSTRRPR